MNDLHNRFRTLDDLSAPNLWSDIEEKALAMQTTRRRSPWVPVVVTLLLALVVAGAVLVGSGVVKLPVSVENSASPSASAQESASPSSTPVAQVPASWTAVGDMIEARASHSATRLLDGTVLVAGGGGFGISGSRSFLASAELYDPATASWTATGSMTQARVLHTATLLQDGRVLVVGGTGDDQHYSAELYDPASGTWTATTDLLNPAPVGHTATLLADGRVLVAGAGLAGLFDPGTGTWSVTGDMVELRYYHSATLLPDGKVLVAGGGQDGSFASAELYDPASETWTATGSMSQARANTMATLLLDGTVLVAGGGILSDIGLEPLASAELYHPASGTWTATGTMMMARARLASYTLLLSGTLLAAGGGQLPSAELYDPSTGSWTATASMSEAHLGATTTLLVDGTVLLAGGSNSSDANGTEIPAASAELYDPGSGT